MSERPTWHADAACKGATSLFYPGQGVAMDDAKTLCQGCPVRVQCLDYALTRPEIHGTWGGESERSRKRIRSALGLRGAA